ncbi:MAG TPA: hypothetical protein PLX97_11985, partial [Gemmatales bacterium]|nr:hypothetical protein [Gemmatales bacterium]
MAKTSVDPNHILHFTIKTLPLPICQNPFAVAVDEDRLSMIVHSTTSNPLLRDNSILSRVHFVSASKCRTEALRSERSPHPRHLFPIGRTNHTATSGANNFHTRLQEAIAKCSIFPAFF